MVSTLKREEQTRTLPVGGGLTCLQPHRSALSLRAILLFDIDGVIRDVSASYRRAIIETVHHYCGWRPQPSAIDALKSEGRWNNDWHAAAELIRRHRAALETPPPPPAFAELVEVFSGFYFGGDPDGDPADWRGFIGAEPLLLDGACFARLSASGIGWGFVSGAEPPSCRFVLETRLGLLNPPLIAMGEAPDKPDPQGLIHLAQRLLAERGGATLGPAAPPVAYLGDTVADVETVVRARRQWPQQRWFSLAVAPPHLAVAGAEAARLRYEQALLAAGADRLLAASGDCLNAIEALLAAADR
ncbi:MAG: TIGR01548 family HAD-type hydrolase [Synechococcaceae cyanobacterium]|nr:TIGR01548 family HAD-type hydrolase [Synechococcaceae cyanobacterium]